MSESSAFLRLGKYELHEELGRGGFGIVYRARDPALEVWRAVKVLHAVLLTDPKFIARFRQEARLAAQLDHPHIVPVYELGEDQGRYYLVMKYLRGGSLKDRLAKEGKLEFQEAVSILLQVAEALDYAYRQKGALIHRDLKPGNILFDEGGKALVGDFGFARSLAESSLSASSGLMLGTPHYMAPEVWRNQPLSPATDVYSLACVFYEMLTGEVLFGGESPPEVMTKHVLEGPQFPAAWPAGVPAGVEEVLRKALAKDPAERYPNVLAFAHALQSTTPRPVGEGLGVRADSPRPVGEGLGVRADSPRPVGEGLGVRADSPRPVGEGLGVRADSPRPVGEGLGGEGRDAGEQGVPAVSTPHLKQKASVRVEFQKFAPLIPVLILAIIFLCALLTGVAYRLYRGNLASSPTLTTSLTESVPSPTLTTSPTESVPSPTLTTSPAETLLSPLQPLKLQGLIAIHEANVSQVSELARFGKGSISEIAYSPQGDLLAVASSLGVYLYEPQTFEPIRFIETGAWVESVAFSPDGALLASGSGDKTVRLWGVRP